MTSFFSSLFKNLAKIIWHILLVALIGAGVYSGAKLYEHKTATSTVFGDIEQHDIYEDFNVFDCDLTDAIFYQTDTGYEYKTTIPKAVSFNGNTNKYNVLINNTPSFYEASTAGILTAQNRQNYYNVEGTQNLQSILSLEMKFYQSKVDISISNSNNAEQQSYFLEYLKFNGLHLRIIEAQYTPQQSSSINYTISFVDWDNTVISVNSYLRGSSITIPDNPTRRGYKFIGWSPQISAIALGNVVYVATYEEQILLSYDMTTDYISGPAWQLTATDTNYYVENNYKNIESIVLNGELVIEYNNETYTAKFDNYQISAEDLGGVFSGDVTQQITFTDTQNTSYTGNFKIRFYVATQEMIDIGDTASYDEMHGNIHLAFAEVVPYLDFFIHSSNSAKTTNNFTMEINFKK